MKRRTGRRADFVRKEIRLKRDKVEWFEGVWGEAAW
jgi:hypothetical protein